MAHDEQIIDSDAHFKISGTSRAIINAEETKMMIVQGDHKSERFTFELPQFIDGHDMSTSNAIQIHYLNINSSTRETSAGIYEVDDMEVDTNDKSEPIIKFSWLLTRNASMYVGSLNFAIRFICIEDAEVVYSWNTVVYSGVSVASTIDNADVINEDYADIIETWRQELFGTGESYLTKFQAIDSSVSDAAATAEAAKTAASQSAEAAANSEKIATDAAKESLGFRTLYSAVRPDLNGNLDPSSDMVVGPGERLTFTANCNRIANVTVHGFTSQAGSGDPSSENVREISNAGICNKKVVIDKDSSLALSGEGSIVGTSRRVVYLVTDLPLVGFSEKGNVLCDILPTKISEETYGKDEYGVSVQHDDSSQGISFRVPRCMTVEDYKAWLTDHPLTVVYESTEDTGKRYTGVKIQNGDNYHCEIFEVNDRLHEGDTVETNVESKFDTELVVTGDESSLYWYAASKALQIKNIKTFGSEENMNGVCTSNFFYTRESSSDTVNCIHSQPGYSQLVIMNSTYYNDLESAKAWLKARYAAGNPLRIFYKSAAEGKPTLRVKRTTLKKKTLVLTGEEAWGIIEGNDGEMPFFSAKIPNASIELLTPDVDICSHFKVKYIALNNKEIGIGAYENSVQIRHSEWTIVDEVKAYLAAQYAAGTPVTIEYELTNPEVYGDSPVIVENPSGTCTVNGESGSNVSVGFKPFQDGGDAETIQGHTWQDILSAIDSAIQTVSVSSQTGS